MTPRSILCLAAVGVLGLSTAALAAPSTKPVPAKRRGTSKSSTLSLSQIKKLVLDGTPGDWKFVNAGSGTLKSGLKVRVGSDYSGHCITYKKQGSYAGINLGHVSNCNQTKGGKNVTFESKTRGPKGGTIRYGDTVAMFVNGNGGEGFVCYGNRDHGINLNWGETDGDCKKLSGSKGNKATQWKIMPASGSSAKIGQPVSLTDRFALHNVVIGQPVVKCARLTGPTTWRSGDLKWRKDCQHYELLWTHRELLEKLGEDPKKLVYDAVPAKYREYLSKVPGL